MAKENIFAHVSITDKNYNPIRNYTYDIKKISLNEFMKIEERTLRHIDPLHILKIFLSDNIGIVIVGNN